jgi:hypothetical protein
MNTKLKTIVTKDYRKKIKKVIGFVTILLSCLLLLGCSPKDPIDISDDPEFASVIGLQFKSLEDLLAIGYTNDANYKPILDFVSIVPKPGFSGPEVIFRDNLPQGQVLEVVGVLSSDNFLPRELFYKVKILGSTQYENASVIIDVNEESMSINRGLDAKLFQSVSKRSN